VEERGHLGIPGAAVHRHILDRMNAINDSLNLNLNLIFATAWAGYGPRLNYNDQAA